MSEEEIATVDMPWRDLPAIMCPGCNLLMNVTLVVSGGPGEISVVTYACAICNAEIVRQYKMPEQPPSTGAAGGT